MTGRSSVQVQEDDKDKDEDQDLLSLLYYFKTSQERLRDCFPSRTRWEVCHGYGA
jgi:hypothetical protein